MLEKICVFLCRHLSSERHRELVGPIHGRSTPGKTSRLVRLCRLELCVSGLIALGQIRTLRSYKWTYLLMTATASAVYLVYP